MINESVYTHVSKAIGWGPSEEKIPDAAWTDILIAAVEAGSYEAFVKLFRIQRFAKSPTTDQEVVQLGRLHQAFLIASGKARAHQEWPEPAKEKP